MHQVGSIYKRLKVDLKLSGLVNSVRHKPLTLKSRTEVGKWKREKCSVIQLQNEDGIEVRVSSCSTNLQTDFVRYTTILSNM